MGQGELARETIGYRLRRLLGARPVSSGLLFFRQFLSHPKAVASIIPTSQVTIDAMLAGVDWETCRLFVEYGPGTGVFTREILRRLRPDARLVAIDPNAVFIDHLLRTLPDPRLAAVQGSAADVEAIVAACDDAAPDYVVSGLPFSTLPPGVGETIVAATARVLRPGGAFLVYQYSLAVKPLLDAAFTSVDATREWRCVPPARLMVARKAEG